MKLILNIRGVKVSEVKLRPPEYDKYLSFEDNYDIRNEYIKKMVKAFKHNMRFKIREKWEIVLVVPSKMNYKFIHLDPEFMKKYFKSEV